MSNNGQQQQARRPRYLTSTTAINMIHITNPWVIAWWSAAFPGFGHHMVGRYLMSWLLLFWEIIINVKGNVNLAILYSLTGDFEKVQTVSQPQELMLYVGVYIFAIWDSYRLSVEGNKQYILANAEDAPAKPFRIGSVAIRYLDQKKPWLGSFWNMITPGLGHLYIGNIPSAFFGLFWAVVLIFASNGLQGVYYTMTGQFETSKEIMNPQYFLFLPSIYSFGLYYGYQQAVEVNKQFEKEQARFLRDTYQSADFEMPL